MYHIYEKLHVSNRVAARISFTEIGLRLAAVSMRWGKKYHFVVLSGIVVTLSFGLAIRNLKIYHDH